MKKVYFLKLVLLFTIVLTSHKSVNAVASTPDSVSMGPGYANEVYYSFANGQVAEVARAGWDIAFHTNRWSATVITNDGVGVTLYAYPKADTSGWAAVDTAGLKTWKPLYNSHTDWEDGAFNRHAAGHPDYGWGVYNMVTHDVLGDSVFILKTENGQFKKFRIIRKNSINNLYTFRFANLDGSEENTIHLDADDYISKNFVAYSIVNKSVVDREPAADSWDIVFTKYMTIHPTGAPYNVTGVLSNMDVSVGKASPVAPNHSDWYSLDFSNSRSAIGWDWKTLNMQTFSFTVEDSTFFYVKDLAGNINRVEFTKFAGSSSGKVVFNKGLSSGASVQETESVNINVWPNPATDKINIRSISGIKEIRIYSVSGTCVMNVPQQNTLQTSLYLNSLKPGVYILEVKDNSTIQRVRFIRK